MDRKTLLLQDQESDCSFDSSEFCSIGERTLSIDSNISHKNFQVNFMTPSKKPPSIDQTLTQKTASIQKPRIQQFSQKNIFQHTDQFQLGFVIGKNKKNIIFNESKVKKARNFFDEEELIFKEDSFQTHSLFQFPKKEESKLLDKDSISFQFSNPCFQNFGKTKKIQIDQNLLEKAKNFFNDDINQDTTEILSFKKPTKVKKVFNQTQKQDNFIKTVNINKNKKKIEFDKIKKKQVFNWNYFFMNFQKSVTKQSKADNKSSKKKSSNLKNNQKISPKITFETIKLKDLDIQQFKKSEKVELFLKKYKQLELLTFDHKKSQCQIIKCLLCSLNVEDDLIDKEKLQDIFSNKLIQEKINIDIFNKLYQQILFKLLKYDIFFPQFLNKRFNPSNILIQMHKKSKLIETGNPCLGWLEFCMKDSKFYHSFIAQVRQIYHNQKIKTYFFKLSDGWSNVWAVITQKNYLYQFSHKLKIFSKIFIGHWKNYPLGNILTFCPLSEQKDKEKCIQIWYNSSILLKQNVKLGKPGSLIFYRSLEKNRKEGGLIPTVEGVILRMFCAFSQTKKKSANFEVDQTFKQNYLEILTPQGYCVLIKFILPSQSSLAELFRLYYQYHFYFLKIGPKENILQFTDGVSKFFEFDKKDKKIYDKQLVKVLKKRYINSMKDYDVDKKMKTGELYDIFIQGEKNIVNGLKFVIDNNNQSETINSYFKGSSCLYQQYELDKVKSYDGQSCSQFTFILKRTKFSNTLKTLPTIYKEINQINDF